MEKNQILTKINISYYIFVNEKDTFVKIFLINIFCNQCMPNSYM